MTGPLTGLRALAGAASSLLRLDAWQNALTGLGIYGRDKTMSHTPGSLSLIPEEVLEDLYDFDGIAARIVDLPVDHAMRKGWRHVPPADSADEMEGTLETIEERWAALDCWPQLGTAWKLGRLFGAGHLMMGVDDGRTLDQPLDEERVKSLDYLVPLDVRDVTPTRFYADERAPKYGEPEVYQVSATIGQLVITKPIHETRMIHFGGASTTPRRWRHLGYQDYSVLQRAYDALRRFDNDWQSASAMMADASVGVLKIRDFFQIITGGGKDTFQTRCELMNLGLASSRVLPLDTDETFERIERTFTGVAQMLDKSTLYLAASIGWPVTVLFGRSPDGMNATGDSDQANWHAVVMALQTGVLLPAAERLQAVVLRSLGIDPAGWSVELPELEEESDRERAERRKLIAETDVAYVGAGIFEPEEIALARVANGEWTDAPPALDDAAREARRTLLEHDMERALEGPEEEETAPAAEALGEPAPEPTAPPAAAPEGEIPIPPEAVNPKAALTGIQTEKMVNIAAQVATGELPPETAIAILLFSYPMTEAEARAIITPAIGWDEPEEGAPPSQGGPMPPAMLAQQEAAKAAAAVPPGAAPDDEDDEEEE